MKVLAKNTRSGNKDGKDWEMTVVHVLTETNEVFEVTLFNVGNLPHIAAGDKVEPIFELSTTFNKGRRTIYGKIVGFTK